MTVKKAAAAAAAAATAAVAAAAAKDHVHRICVLHAHRIFVVCLTYVSLLKVKTNEAAKTKKRTPEQASEVIAAALKSCRATKA